MPGRTPLLAALASALLTAGCGINKSHLATEQLVISDAVDKAVATIDFSPLSRQARSIFDTQYLDGVNMGPNGNIKYVISSLRQQMMAYDLRLQEKADTADYVVEGRWRAGQRWLRSDLRHSRQRRGRIGDGVTADARARCRAGLAGAVHSAGEIIRPAPRRSACSPTTALRASPSGKPA